MLIIYATINGGHFANGLSGVSSTAITGFSSKEACLEAKSHVLEMKDEWKHNQIKPFGIACIEVK